MIDFDFVSPTKIFFGKQKEEKVGEAAKEFGFKKVLIVYGSHRIETNGLLTTVTAHLKENSINFCLLGGVRPNPLIAKVREGISLAKQEGVDSLLAIGGGSTIDTCKAIAAGYFYEGDAFDFNLHKATPKKALPIGVILTFASAGSELSNSCVIQDDERCIKQGFNSDLVRPKFAIMNPELTYGVPNYQKAAGISDIIMHSLERYCVESEGYTLSDEWALDLIKKVIENGKTMIENPSDYQSHATIMLCGSLSHNGLTHLGKRFQFTVHPIEHGLSGYKPDITHGAGVALLYPAWAMHVVREDPERFAYFAKRVFNISLDDKLETAIIGIRQMKEFFSSIGMPTTFREVGLTKKDIPALVNLISGNGTRVIGCYPQSLNKQDLEEIFLSLC